MAFNDGANPIMVDRVKLKWKKMKILFILILVSNTYCLSAQNKPDSTIILTHFRIDRVKERQRKIDIFADSINNYNGGNVPCFLYNECFDLNAPLWRGLHSSVSLRWEVLQRVNNKKALKMLLKSANKRELNKKCSLIDRDNQEDRISLIDKSFGALIRKRYIEMD